LELGKKGKEEKKKVVSPVSGFNIQRRHCRSSLDQQPWDVPWVCVPKKRWEVVILVMVAVVVIAVKMTVVVVAAVVVTVELVAVVAVVVAAAVVVSVVVAVVAGMNSQGLDWPCQNK
jgi:hypothetical protein